MLRMAGCGVEESEIHPGNTEVLDVCCLLEGIGVDCRVESVDL